MKKKATDLHSRVPPDWYYRSIKENPIQRYWHTQRFKEVSKLIEPTKGKILDIGSADGVFTKNILEKSEASEVIGIDVMKSSVDWANSHWKDKRLRFLVGDAHKLKFNSGSFDAVFALEVLEHVHKPSKVLKEIYRVLNKRGYAVLLVPTDVWYFKFLWDNFWTKTRGSIWNDTHLHSYTADSLIKLSEKTGFNIEVNKKFLFGMLQVIRIRK